MNAGTWLRRRAGAGAAITPIPALPSQCGRVQVYRYAGMMLLTKSATVYTDGSLVNTGFTADNADLFGWLRYRPLGVPTPVMAIVLSPPSAYAVHHTRLGRYIYALAVIFSGDAPVWH